MFAAVSRAATLSTAALQKSNDTETYSSSTLPEVDALRDMRAYEHARQRVKRAEEIARRKALKERSVSGGNMHHPSATGSSAKAKAASGSSTDDTSSASEPWAHSSLDDWERTPMPSIAQSPLAMKLEDIVAKPAKSRKSKRKDAEYEMVSPLPTVIALDDANYRDITIDEPWEYIPRPDEVPKASYAAVLRA
ncbi:hypothetical protein GGG16DRAFT_83628 [Schizophyllum commune]